jgi:hypothetical protein
MDADKFRAGLRVLAVDDDRVSLLVEKQLQRCKYNGEHSTFLFHPFFSSILIYWKLLNIFIYFFFLRECSDNSDARRDGFGDSPGEEGSCRPVRPSDYRRAHARNGWLQAPRGHQPRDGYPSHQ